MPDTHFIDIPSGDGLTLLSSGFRRDQTAILHKMREHCPVHLDPVFHDVVITSASVGDRVLRDPSLSVDPRNCSADSAGVKRGEDIRETPTINFSDDPMHARLRVLGVKAFNPLVKGMRPVVNRVVNELIDDIEHDEFDFRILDFRSARPGAALNGLGQSVTSRTCQVSDRYC